MPAKSIGDVARASGVKVPTIRYYEEIGLVPSPPRSEGNRRLYDEATIRRLKFIRHSRELGFEIEAIRDLMSLQDQPDRECESVDIIARERLREVRQRIAALKALETELTGMIEQCGRGSIGDCRVIEALSAER